MLIPKKTEDWHKERETTETGHAVIGVIKYTWSKKVPCMIK
jgi:hypothetical protein